MVKSFFFVLWLLSALVLLFVSSIPFSLETEIAISIVILSIISLIKLIDVKVPIIRTIFLALSTFLVIKYIIWRTNYTIPSIENLIEYIPALILYGAEMFSVIMFFLGVFVMINPKSRKIETLPEDESLWPTIDVLIPTYNENISLVKDTVMGAINIHWPKDKINIYVLDDGSTVEKRNSKDSNVSKNAYERYSSFKNMCSELGVNYLTREKNNDAKAGNLNAALDYVSGELILVLDADHIPTQDILEKTVGLFLKDEQLFLVQTPHFFINPDPLERSFKTFEIMPSENEMFYYSIHKGLDKWNSSFFCGSAAILKRSAIDEVGGIQGDSITEDAETALELHSRGYNSAYIDEPLIAGLQPENFAGFIMQRQRWAQGMMQIFRWKLPFFKRGLKWYQKICYISSMLYWFFPIPRLVLFTAPLLYLFFDIRVFVATSNDFYAYILPYILSILIMSNYVYGKYRWPFISEVYEYIQSLYLFRTVIGTIIRPKKTAFRVTNKGEFFEQDNLSNLKWPIIIFFNILLLGMFFAIYKYINFPNTQIITLVVGSWNLFALLLTSRALAVICETKQRRANHRIPIEYKAKMNLDNHEYEVEVTDFSRTGCKFNFLKPSKSFLRDFKDKKIKLYFRDKKYYLDADIKNINQKGVRYYAGVKFYDDNIESQFIIIKLMFGNSELWKKFIKSRQDKSPGLLKGSLLFFAGCIKDFLWAIYFITSLLILKKKETKNV